VLMKRLQRYVFMLISLLGGFGVVGLCGSSRLHFSSRTSAINLQSGSQFTVGQSITGFNGMLVKSSNATLSGGNISFENGSVEEDGDLSVLTGTFSPATGKILLQGGDRLRSEPGVPIGPVTISGEANRIDGQPYFTSAIVFESSATATFAIQSSLTKNIQFDASGTNTLFLDGDLSLADDVTIVNDGTIDVNGKEFWFGGKALTLANNIYWLNAGAVNLRKKMILDGTWKINSETVINGHGNIIDVSGGGVFDIKASTTLHLTDVVLKAVQSGTFVFGDNGSTIYMSNVTVQLHEDVSFSSGLFTVEGPTTFLMHDNDLTFGGESSLTVSGVTLWLDGIDQNRSGDVSGNLSMVYNGTIKEVVSHGNLSPMWQWIFTNSNAIANNWSWIVTNSNAIDSNWDLTVASSDAIVVLRSEVDLVDVPSGDVNINRVVNDNGIQLYDVYLSPHHKMTFTYDLLFDGSTHFFYFSQTDETILTVESGITVTMENVELRDFSENKISLGDGAGFIFGNDTKIEISSNEAFNLTWTCSGSVIFNGGGKQVELGTNGGFYVMAGSNLVIDDVRLVGLQGEKIKCEDYTASIVLKNCNLMLSDTFNFNNGSILFDQDVCIDGEKPFCYCSSVTSTIASKSTLCLEKNLTFSYDPGVVWPDLLRFEDSSSTLLLKGATFYSTATGVQLKTGKLWVAKPSYIASEGDAEFSLGNDSSSEDIKTVFEEGIRLELLDGSLAYRNVGSSALDMPDELSVIKINAGKKLKLYQTMEAGEGTAYFGDGAYLLAASGKTLNATVVADGSIQTGLLP